MTRRYTERDQRVEWAESLRALARLIEANPELPMPYSIDASWIETDAEATRDMMRAFAKAVPGQKRKRVSEAQYNLEAKIGPVRLTAIAWREEVCERVVVGTDTVTIPATEAVEAQPERTEEREVVEWRCHPILADEQVPA